MAPRVVPLLLLLLLAALVGAATWFVLGGEDGPGEFDHVAVDGAPQADPVPAQLDPVEFDPADEPGASVAADTDDEQVRQEVTASPDGSAGPVLRVVDAASGAPVPMAEVFADEAGGDWRQRADGSGHWAERLERSTPARRTDARGEVTLPAVRRRLLVAARADGRFGVAFVRPSDKQPVLELVPDLTLRVLVRDGAGQPVASVPVGLCVDLRERLQRVSRATTDAGGIAELRHVQLFETRVPPPNPAADEKQRLGAEVERTNAALQQLRVEFGNFRNLQAADQERVRAAVREAMVRFERSRQQLSVASRQLDEQSSQVEEQRRRRAPETQAWPLADFVVTAEVPQIQPALLRFPARAIPGDIVELRLPAMSSLVVHLLGPDGAPLRSPCSVMLRVDAGTRVAGTAPANFDDLCTMRIDKALGADTVVFAPVGLGLHFDLHVRFADNDFNFQHENAAGPLTLAPQEIEVRTPAWFTMLAGRFVDDRGRALAGVEAEIFVAGARGRVEGERLRPEDDGRFELPLRLRNPAPPYTLEVQARIGDRRFGKLIGLPELVQGRRTEIGEVVLKELPVLASGTVRNDLGEPLAPVDVVVNVLRGDRWTEESFVRDRTDTEGKFLIYGEPRPQRLQLTATLRRHAGETRAIVFGERVEIVLSRTGAIQAEGMLPPFVPREAVFATLADAAGGKPRDIQVRPRPNNGFELRIGDLRPGAWDLMVRVRGLPRPLAVAERIFVRPGETVRPATIDGLDLRGQLFEFMVRAVDQAGQPMPDPGSPLLVELRDERGLPTLVPFAWRSGRVRVITDQPSVNVIGMASGHRPARALIQAGDSTLTLTRLHPLVLQLPGLRAQLGAQQAARISLVFVGDTGVPGVDLQASDQSSGRTRGYSRAALGKAGGAGLGADDTVSVALMFNGRYEIVLRVDGPGGRVSKTIGFVDAVLDGASPMTVTVSPDGRAVQDAMAELRARPPRRR